MASATGFDAHAWRLPVVLWTFHNVCGHWHDGTLLHRLALDAARRRGDLSGEAHALRGLGSFAMSLSAFDASRIVTADLDGNGRDEVILNIPGFGIWVLYNNTSWTQLHSLSASVMAAGVARRRAKSRSDRSDLA